MVSGQKHLAFRGNDNMHSGKLWLTSAVVTPAAAATARIAPSDANEGGFASQNKPKPTGTNGSGRRQNPLILSIHQHQHGSLFGGYLEIPRVILRTGERRDLALCLEQGEVIGRTRGHLAVLRDLNFG